MFTPFERIHYTYGLLLDETRLQREQHAIKRRSNLINRLMSGSGVVCGLSVFEAQAENGLIAIDRGCALDDAGNMILVPEVVQLDPRQLTDEQGNPLGEPLTEGIVEVCLAYAEQLVDPVPVFIPDPAASGDSAYSSIREGYRLIVRQAAEAPPSPPACTLGELSAPVAETLHALMCERVSAACPEPASPACVPLARVTLPLTEASIDQCSGRSLVYNNALLYELILCLAERLSQLEQG